MFHRQHKGQFITGVGHHLQQIIQLLRQFAADDGEVDLTVGNAPAGAPGAVDLKLHRHIWIFLTKQTDHPRHQIGARRLTRPDDQRSPLEVVQIIQGPAGLMALTQDPIAVAEQQMAGFRELRLAPAAVEQGHLQLLLEVLNLEADRGLGDVKAVGRLLETSLTDDGPQDAQLIQRERQIGHRNPDREREI